jgi:hypothetical protein
MDIVHASDLMKDGLDFCPRAFVFHDLLRKPQKDAFVSTSEAMTFRLGYKMQELITEICAEADRAVSDWRCACCSTVTHFSKRPKVCPICGCKTFLAEEPRFTSMYSGVSCGVDLFFDSGSSEYLIYELKSIKKDAFATLTMPLAEHRWRTNLYMRIIDESNSPYKHQINLKEAHVLYFCKTGYGVKDITVSHYDFADSGFSPFKDFVVTRNDDETNSKVELARKILLYRSKEAGIPQGICSNSFCKDRKSVV